MRKLNKSSNNVLEKIEINPFILYHSIIMYQATDWTYVIFWSRDVLLCNILIDWEKKTRLCSYTHDWIDQILDLNTNFYVWSVKTRKKTRLIQDVRRFYNTIME